MYDLPRCFAKSFFSRTMEAQFATGATHDIRIFTGSVLLAELNPKRPSTHAKASANFCRRMVFLPVSPGLRILWQASRRERRRLSEVQPILASPAWWVENPRSGTWNPGMGLCAARSRRREPCGSPESRSGCSRSTELRRSNSLLCVRFGRFLMPDQQSAPDQRHRLDERVADDGDF